MPPPRLIPPEVAFKPYLNYHHLCPTVLNTFLHCTTLLKWHTLGYGPWEFEHATTFGSVHLCNQNYQILSHFFPQLSHNQSLAWWKILLALQICINSARTFRENILDPMPANNCNGGVPGAKWRPVSLYRVSKLFPPRLHCYSVALAPLGVWTKGPRVVYGPLGERITWSSRNPPVGCLAHRFGSSQRANKECADIRLLGTLPGVYTHFINAGE